MYGYRISYYTRKVFCYLKYRNINFIEKKPNAWDMYNFQKKVGAAVMPVLKTADGKLIQDSREIIDTLDAKFESNPIVPPKSQPKRRFVANLVEAWTDDMWLAPAMHYRWHYPENYPLFQEETGESLFPTFLVPKFIKNKAAEKVASTLRRFVPLAGGSAEQLPVIESWVGDMCDLLDVHFASSGTPFLLGSAATLADFGLAGPVVAHLAYDAYPLREVTGKRKHLMRWVERIQTAAPVTANTNAAGDDVIPSTLEPVLKVILEEYTPFLQATVDKVSELTTNEKFKSGKPLPRVLVGGGLITHKFGSCAAFKRAAMPFTLWKAQGLLSSIGASDIAAVSQYLSGVSSQEASNALMNMKIPQLTRQALRVKFKNV